MKKFCSEYNKHFSDAGLLHSSIWSGIGHNKHEIEAKTSGHPHLNGHRHQKLNQRGKNLLRKIDEIFQFSDEKPILQQPMLQHPLQPRVEQITQPLVLGN